METQNTSKSEETQNGNTSKPSPENAGPSGLDLNSLLTPGALEYLKPLLSSGLTLAGVHFFLLKPVNEKIDKLADQVKELEKRLNVQKEYILNLEAKQADMENDLGKVTTEKRNGLFETKRYPSSSRASSPLNDYRRPTLNL